MIREATNKDILGLAILMGELGYLTTNEEMEQRFLNISENPYYKTIIYEEDERIIGMVGMMLGLRYEKNESYIRVVALVVDSKFRGLGIGTKLLLEAEKWAKEQGANMITLNSGNRNERNIAHQFYISRGFEGKATGFYKELK